MIGATYAVIDDPRKPDHFRSLAAIGKDLAKRRDGRRVQMVNSVLTWGAQPDETRPCVSVEFMAPEATREKPVVSARVVVLTGRGEQARTVFAAMMKAINSGATP